MMVVLMPILLVGGESLPVWVLSSHGIMPVLWGVWELASMYAARLWDDRSNGECG